MTDEKLPEDNEESVSDLEKENEGLKKNIEELKEKLEKATNEKSELNEKLEKFKKENSNLKKQLARVQGSLPVLAASEKTAKAVGVPSSKIFYRPNRTEGVKKHTGGQPGHPGHGRKRPTANAPPVYVTLDACPDCDNLLGDPIEGAEQKRTITDIPLPEHLVYEVIYTRYWCKKCCKIVRGEIPWLPPHQEFGPAVASWIAYQRMLGLSVPKVQSSLFETYCLSNSEASILNLEMWVADSLKGDYNEIHEDIVKAKALGGDETKFRINGLNGWMWVFTGVVGTYYKIAPTRGHVVPDEVLNGFDGVLGRDAWKSYDRVKCSDHQLDLLHVNRWLQRAEVMHRIEPRGLLTSRPAKMTGRGRPPETFIQFADGLRAILKETIRFVERTPHPSMNEREKAYKRFRKTMKAFVNKERMDDDARRISKELRKRLNMLFTFVKKANVPWHNNDAERAIRQGVLHRKISGGRRTWRGAEILEVLLSISETAKKRGIRFLEWAKKSLNMSMTGWQTKNALTS